MIEAVLAGDNQRPIMSLRKDQEHKVPLGKRGDFGPNPPDLINLISYPAFA
jgi:hypothetical protein